MCIIDSYEQEVKASFISRGILFAGFEDAVATQLPTKIYWTTPAEAFNSTIHLNYNKWIFV